MPEAAAAPQQAKPFGSVQGQVRSWPWLTWSAERWLFAVCLVVLTVLMVPPMLMLVRTSVVVGERLGRQGELSLGAYAAIFSSGDLLGLLLSTVVFALGSTVVGLVVGGSLAWVTERTDTPFKELVYAAMFVTFAVPGILRTIGWIFLLGPRTGTINEVYRAATGAQAPLLDAFSMPAMVLVEGLFWVPIVFLMLAAAFR
jgi:iron(III) transport system permease protein